MTRTADSYEARRREQGETWFPETRDHPQDVVPPGALPGRTHRFRAGEKGLDFLALRARLGRPADICGTCIRQGPANAYKVSLKGLLTLKLI